MPDAAYRINLISADTGTADPATALEQAGLAGATWPALDGFAQAVAEAPANDPRFRPGIGAVGALGMETEGITGGWRAVHPEDTTARAVALGPELNAERLAGLVGALHTEGLMVTGLRELSATFRAVELTLAGPAADPAAMTRALRPEAEAAGVDLAVLPPAEQGPETGLLMMDMDSTLLAVECIDELAEHAGVKAEVAAITERAMNGELDFAGSLIERVRMLAGLPESVLEATYGERIRTNPGARRLIDAARARGFRIAVVSGGFTFFTDRLAQDLALDYTRANTLASEQGQLTGEVAGAIVDGGVKAETLTELRDELGLRRDQLVVLGDGANDLPMIREAGLGVAFHAKPHVREQAPYNLAHSPLDGTLYLLGWDDDHIQSLLDAR